MTQILIVDDDPLIRQALKQILTNAGFDTLMAEDGMRAARILARTPVEVVLTDIWMPEREGLETIMHITRVHPEISIIAMSGGGQVRGFDVLKLARSLGAVSCLAKPFSISDVLTAVDRARHRTNAA